jgi:molybdopterin-synthase adenylyltransferase
LARARSPSCTREATRIHYMKPKLHERYSRQILFANIGERGQQRLLASAVTIVGCGALGAAVANLLARAGVGRIRIIDRDFVEPSNLQRQTLFTEEDALEALPKAVAADRRLRAINSDVEIQGIVADLGPKNAEELLSGSALILDGTDNFETRFLLNDVAVKFGIPWIYAAVVGSYGVTMTIRPGTTPCLACLLEPPRFLPEDQSAATANGPEPGEAPRETEDTCDTVGVLASAAGVIASIQAAEAIKLLVGEGARGEHTGGKLVSFDVWSGEYRAVRVEKNPACRTCVSNEFRYLDGQAQPHVTMCGRNSVQIHEHARNLDFVTLAQRLAPVAADVRQNGFLLRFRVPPHEVTVFADGRAIIKGTRDPGVARSLYARYLGS